MKTKILLIASLTAGLFFSEIVSAQKSLYTFPFGVQTYTFRRSIGDDPAKVLDTIKMLGFTEVEGGGGRIAPGDFKKLCDERGISIPSTGADYGQLVSAPDSVVMRAKALGAKYVMCAWIPHEDGVLTFESAKKAVDDFNKAGKFLKDNGLIFCYHAHGYEFQPYEDGTLLDYIVKNTNPEYVSFEMDIFWMQFGGGDPVESLGLWGERINHVHIKDARADVLRAVVRDKGDMRDVWAGKAFVPLGDGDLNVEEFMDGLVRTGYDGWLVLEQDSIPQPGDDPDLADKHHAINRNVLRKWIP